MHPAATPFSHPPIHPWMSDQHSQGRARQNELEEIAIRANYWIS